MTAHHTKKKKVARNVLNKVMKDVKTPMHEFDVFIIAKPRNPEHPDYCPYGRRAYETAKKHGLKPLFVAVRTEKMRNKLKKDMGIRTFPQIFVLKNSGKHLHYIEGGSEGFIKHVEEKARAFNALA